MHRIRRNSIIAIQNRKNSRKLLVYFDQEWGFWMFPSCKMIDSDDIREYLAGELCVKPEHIYFEFEGIGHETKYSTAHEENRSYRYFVHIGRVKDIPDEDFNIGKRQYRWMTPEEMLEDDATKTNNDYLVNIVREML